MGTTTISIILITCFISLSKSKTEDIDGQLSKFKVCADFAKLIRCSNKPEEKATAIDCGKQFPGALSVMLIPETGLTEMKLREISYRWSGMYELENDTYDDGSGDYDVNNIYDFNSTESDYDPDCDYEENPEGCDNSDEEYDEDLEELMDQLCQFNKLNKVVGAVLIPLKSFTDEAIQNFTSRLNETDYYYDGNDTFDDNITMDYNSSDYNYTYEAFDNETWSDYSHLIKGKTDDQIITEVCKPATELNKAMEKASSEMEEEKDDHFVKHLLLDGYRGSQICEYQQCIKTKLKIP